MSQKFILDFEKPIYDLSNQLEVLNERASLSDVDFSEEIEILHAKILETKKRIYSSLTEWQTVQLARHPVRPYSLDYIDKIFTNFQELHGDRLYADDRSMICGFGELDGLALAVVAQQKGRTTKENIMRNFGMQNPEGYRKAMRVMKLADKFRLPIVTFVDTPGAFPGVESEERHVAEAIAVNLREMMLIQSPIISIFIGEGGSGGALGIAVADRVLVLENAYYSVISPEGCAAILWNDRTRAPDAAKALKLSPKKLIEFGVADEIIYEPLGGAHQDYDFIAAAVKKSLKHHLSELIGIKGKELMEYRYRRFRRMGIFDIDNDNDTKTKVK